MKKIIVPVDFSEYSEYALQTAAKLAKKYGAELLMLHMLEMPDVVLTASTGDQSMKIMFYLKLAETKMAKFLEKDYLKDIKVTPVIKHFKVFSEINDVAIEHDADLIVMGTKGVTGFKEIFIGSNTERVVRFSEVPVLIVKNTVTDINFDVVAFASDFSEASIPSYLKAVKLFESMNSKLHLVHVNLPDDSFRSSIEIENRVVNFFAKVKGNLYSINDVNYVSDYNVEDGILNFSNKIGADLIAVSTYGKKGLAHFFQGSVGESMANHSTLPVITFKV